MGRRAFGWTADDTALIPAEAEELRRAARDYDAGISLKQIVRQLNDRKVPTSEGNEWSVTALGRMLKNPRMIGRSTDKLGRPIMIGKLVYPPVLSTPDEIELWKRIRGRRTDPGLKQKREDGSPDAELKDSMICGLCRAKLAPSRPKKRRMRYVCHVSYGCGRMSIQAHLAEQHVAHEVCTYAGQIIPGATEVSVAAWWNTADLEARRELIGGMVETIALHPTAPGRRGSGRLEITWQDMPSWPAGLVSAA